MNLNFSSDMAPEQWTHLLRGRQTLAETAGIGVKSGVGVPLSERVVREQGSRHMGGLENKIISAINTIIKTKNLKITSAVPGLPPAAGHLARLAAPLAAAASGAPSRGPRGLG